MIDCWIRVRVRVWVLRGVLLMIIGGGVVIPLLHFDQALRERERKEVPPLVSSGL